MRRRGESPSADGLADQLTDSPGPYVVRPSGERRSPLLSRAGFCHFRFGVNPQGIGDAIDVVEVGNHLDGVQDIAVGEPVLAEGFDILTPQRRREARHPLCKLDQGLLARRESCSPPVFLEMLGQRRVAGFSTEILSVCLDSIETLVGPGDDGCQHFSLRPREA